MVDVIKFPKRFGFNADDEAVESANYDVEAVELNKMKTLDDVIDGLQAIRSDIGSGDIEIGFSFFREEGEIVAYLPRFFEMFDDSDEDGGGRVLMGYLEEAE